MSQQYMFDLDAYGGASVKKLAPIEPDPPYQPYSETSRAAAESIKPALNSLQQAVLSYLRNRGDEGATDEEMQENIPLSQNCQRPRRVELCVSGHVCDSGRTRKARSGRQATVWVARN